MTGVGSSDRLDHAWGGAGNACAVESDLADPVTVAPLDEVLLEVQPFTGGGPDLGADGVVGGRKHSHFDAEGGGDGRGDDAQGRSGSQGGGAEQIRGEVVVAETERRVDAEGGQPGHHLPRVVAPPPSLRALDARQGVDDRVDVRRDV